jgi:myo-inositol 2-dehydrogenase/D-chiro-inositol 1-dehydrogenase
MRVGVVGVGRIGVLHAGTLTDDPRVDALVVADLDRARARTVAAELGAGVAEVDELFESGLDAVVVATGTAAHAGLVHRALDAAVPVFCEKPLAPDLAGTAEVLVHANATGVPLQVGFQRRFDAGYRAAREAVRDGELGFVHSLLATTYDATPPDAGYIAASGGIFRDCLIHDFDAIRFVTGREVASVYVTGGNKGDEFFAAAGDVDTAAAALLLDDGTVATVLGGRYNGAGYDVRLEVHGSEGMLAAGLDEHVPLRPADPGATWPDGKPYPGFFERFRDAYTTELSDFIGHARGELANPCPPEEALEALYVAEAAALSLAEERPVRMDEVR